MNEFYFKETGKLEIDKIFFESYYPILFTCKNEKRELFLCVCSQFNQNIRKWLVVKTTTKTIIELLTDVITIREAFLKSTNDRYTITQISSNNDFKITVNDKDDWDDKNSLDLPSQGEYLDADKDEFCDEINYYK